MTWRETDVRRDVSGEKFFAEETKNFTTESAQKTFCVSMHAFEKQLVAKIPKRPHTGLRRKVEKSLH